VRSQRISPRWLGDAIFFFYYYIVYCHYHFPKLEKLFHALQGHAEGALPGFIGSASFSQRNLFGLNQKLAATVEIGQARALSPRSFEGHPLACHHGSL
jgi:hypothetical protein